MDQQFVCPLPIPWSEIYKRLMSAWEQRGRLGEPPPRLLILAGWAYSNDAEKQQRWQDTVHWAEQHNCAHLVELHEDAKYYVYQMSTYTVGSMGGPMYLDWDFTPKIRPPQMQVKTALATLCGRWREIAGEELANHTAPLRFTGQKRRKLLVEADPAYRPPWGSWDCLDYGENRRSFTRLREAVNRAIAPLMVDHIEFQTTTHTRRRPNDR